MNARREGQSVPPRMRDVPTPRARMNVCVSGKICTRTLKGTAEVSALNRVM